MQQQTKLALFAGGIGYAVLSELENVIGLKSDLSILRKLYLVKKFNKKAEEDNLSVADLFYQTLDRVGLDKTAIIFENDDNSTRIFTFSDLEIYSNKIAMFLIAQGLQEGDTVALFMENRPEFIGTWLGACKVGIRIALINTSIVKKGLVHCIQISNAQGVIYGVELQDSILEIAKELNPKIKLWSSGNENGSIDKTFKSSKIVSFRGRERRSSVNYRSPWGYIYTSGTTGLPKAAIVNHNKIIAIATAAELGFQIKQTDIIYTCLPLFHSAGGGLGGGLVIIGGLTMVLRKKFSARQFFQDCQKHQVTVIQYIGELCRYLVNSPPNALVDTNHKVRIAIGNGLRPEIWEEFQRRFNIKEIGEFYGATEGNGSLFNHCKSKEAVGCVGRLGLLLRKATGFKLIKIDIEKETRIRNSNGFCIEVGQNETGELLMPIKVNEPSTQFSGYLDSKETEKKILRNVFVTGDMYYSTGDLLSRDSKGYYRFVDRIGDTFRWKGENCSTTEVTEVISTFPGIHDCNVYGVLIPNNQDGRAPCAAIYPYDGDLSKIDLKAFHEYCVKNLPSYAIPLFLRIIVDRNLEVTATLKHVKGELRSDGIDISKIKNDQMFFLYPGKGYVSLTPQVYSWITTSNSRL